MTNAYPITDEQQSTQLHTSLYFEALLVPIVRHQAIEQVRQPAILAQNIRIPDKYP
ncbi:MULTISPECIES: hypothetical protein [unclassified Sphingomonas]|uniref:hypothetical protein n=1 Tax=unclassified Sphingomonas TaxID=196159 RepID=UPI00286003EC|nr:MULTISPECIES: hypothetical protein [unclassified Sphingomonas]MDR6116696.1 hypothetical protein [Sphingomonas sp. SORGH_AS_0789]MDR6149626.1 hypothetical protein [Sphingomonas sp. SORGH_AS_0742]